MTDLTQLEALARAATPGEWVARLQNDYGFFVEADGRQEVCANVTEPDAAYIAAANPVAILALIERARVVEAIAKAFCPGWKP